MRFAKAVFSFFLLPLLPRRFRASWPWIPPASVEALAHVSVWMHMVASLVAYGLSFVIYQQAYAEKVAEAIAETDAEPGAITWYGAVTFFSFFFTPQGLLLGTYVVDSAARFTHVMTTGEPMGSLFLSAPLLLAGRLLDWSRERKLTRRYGPASEPDRVSFSGDGLVLRANRPHTTWHGLLTYGYGEGMYKLQGFREAKDGERRCFEYLFGPWPDRDMVRKIVRLDGAEGDGGGR